jgi:hypothetical protein
MARPQTRRPVHWRRGTKGDASGLHRPRSYEHIRLPLSENRQLEAARRKNRSAPPQPSLPGHRHHRALKPGRCRRCPFFPGTRQSGTPVIYQSSAKLAGLFRSKASETIHPPAMGNGYVEIASPVPLPVGRRNNFKGGSQPPFFLWAWRWGLARSRAAPLLGRSESLPPARLSLRADKLRQIRARSRFWSPLLAGFNFRTDGFDRDLTAFLLQFQ